MPKRNLILALLAVGLACRPSPAQDTVRRVTQAEALKAATAKPQPDYPPIARQLKIEGRVDLEVSISPSGGVDDVKILTGNPALTGAAVNAVKRWRFDPFTSEGKPVPALAVVSFTFHR